MRRHYHWTSNLLRISIVAFLPAVGAQIGTMKQDITTAAAFPLQKRCAQKCIVDGGFCPQDVLGEQILCATYADFNLGGWSNNDCYCRQDIQGPAQAWITACIKDGCTVGDVAIDASTAGSIYAQYCKEKGYLPATAPAAIPATATTGEGGALSRTTGVGSGPTSSSTASPPSSSNKLPVTTIIGIAVGGLAGLLLLSWALKAIHACVRESHIPEATRPQLPGSYQMPVYPMTIPFPDHPVVTLREPELTPDDSISTRSCIPEPAPTLISDMPGYGPPPPYAAR